MTKSALAAILAVAIAIVAMTQIVALAPRVVNDPQDLRAFYCGGKTLALHRDPYRAEPLRACERATSLAAGLHPYAGLAIPSPLPPFALVPFAALALLDFEHATGVYTILLLAAFAATGLLLVRLTRIPAYAAFAALALGEGLVSILNGQIVPIAIAALCAAAFELRRDRPVRAAIYASLAAIEPHIALPALAALAVAVPRGRVPLAGMLGGFASVSLLAGGVASNVEYLTAVLGAQARSELFAGDQYGLATLLARAGAAPNASLAAGSLDYALTAIAGIAIGIRLARRNASPELVMLVPAAVALLGGPYVHLVQMAAAIPALLVCIVRLPAQRVPLLCALLLLEVPWRDLAANGPAAAAVAAFAISAAVAFGVWHTLANARLPAGESSSAASSVAPAPRDAAALPAAAVAALAGIALASVAFGEAMLLAAAPHADPTAAILRIAEPGLLAEATWSAYVVATSDPSFARYLGGNLPTWAALIVLVAVTSRAAFGEAGTENAPGRRRPNALSG